MMVPPTDFAHLSFPSQRHLAQPTMLAVKPHHLRAALPLPPNSAPLRRWSSSLFFLPSSSSSNCLPTSSVSVFCSAKKLRGRRRPAPRIDRSAPAVEEEEEDTGSVRLPVLPSLGTEQPPPLEQREYSSSSTKEDGGGKEEGTMGTPLRGWDVLKALQKAAAAQKESANRKGKRQGGRRSNRVGGEQSIAVEIDARPLNFKEDWGNQLDELEKLIEEFQAQQHHRP